MRLIPVQLVDDATFEKASKECPGWSGMPVLLKASALWPQPDGEWIVFVSRPPSPERMAQMERAESRRPWWRFW